VKLLVINGPNLNMLGIREPDNYGKTTYNDLICLIKENYKNSNLDLEFYQSNHEGELIDIIHKAYFEKIDGIIINAGAYTHTSIAIYDALISVSIPTAEVHITDIYNREDFRKINYIKDACVISVVGKGINGYIEAIDRLIDYLG